MDRIKAEIDCDKNTSQFWLRQGKIKKFRKNLEFHDISITFEGCFLNL